MSSPAGESHRRCDLGGGTGSWPTAGLWGSEGVRFHLSMRWAVVDDAASQLKAGTILSGQYRLHAVDVGKDRFGKCHRKALLIQDNGSPLQRRPSATMSQRKSWTRRISRRAGRMSAERNKMRGSHRTPGFLVKPRVRVHSASDAIVPRRTRYSRPESARASPSIFGPSPQD